MKNQLIENLDIDSYHAHKSISRSGLMKFLQSPQHYWWHYLSGQAEKEDTTPLRIGGAFHALVLEPDTFKDRAIILPEDAPKKPSITQLNAAKPSEKTVSDIAWWDAFESKRNGRALLKSDEMQDLKDMAAALLAQPASSKIIAKNGKIEASFFWTDEDYKVDVKCRPDYYRDDGIVLDLKTVEDAGRDAFERSIVNYGYDIQAWMCMEGIERVTGKRPESFIFCCVEKKKPHAVAFYMADGELLECGSHRYAKIMSRYAECKQRNLWPGYGHLIQPIGVPSWFAKRIEKGEEK